MTDIADAVAPLSQSVDSLNKSFSNLSNVISSITTKFSSFVGGDGKNASGVLSTISSTADKAKASINGLADSTSDFGKNLGAAISGATQFYEKLSDSGAEISQFYMHIKLLSDSATSSSSALNTLAKDFDTVADSAKALSNIKSVLPKELQESPKFKILDSLIETKKQVDNFETSLIQAAAAGGNLNKVFGDNFQNTENAMRAMADSAAVSANRVGMNFEKMLKITTTIISELPGEVDKSYKLMADVGDGFNREFEYSSSELAVQVSRGIGRSVNDTINMSKSMAATFGSDMADAATRMAMIGNIAELTGTKFDRLESIVKDLDSSFGLWGDQMKSAGDIFVNVSNSLKDSGVGYEGQINVVRSLTDSIKNLMSAQNMGMRSFIGSDLGGGMVSNALQMEKMLQEEGGMGKIATMMENKLKQYGGGRVLTLEDAQQEGNQREFLTQRNMLGKMGISDTATANRLMEAMAKGDIGEGGLGKKEDILAAALGKGETVQEKQVTLLDKIAINSDYLKVLTQINQRDVVGQVLGDDRTPEAREKLQDERAARIDIQNQKDRRAGLTNPDAEIASKAAGDLIDEQSRNSIEAVKNISKINLGVLRKIPGVNDMVSKYLEEKSTSTDKDITEVQKALSNEKDGDKRKGLEAKLAELQKTKESVSIQKESEKYIAPSISDSAPKQMSSRPSYPIVRQDQSTKSEPIEANLNIHIYRDNDELVERAVIKLADTMTMKGR